MIDKLREYNSRINKQIREKLLLEINVEFNEYEILKRSLFSQDYRQNLYKKLEDIVTFLSRNCFEDVFLKEAISNFSTDDINTIDSLIDCLNSSIDLIYNKLPKESNTPYKIRQILYQINQIKAYLVSQVIIIKGDGATGKTHLLTKLTEELLYENYPAIIMYGHQLYNLDDQINLIGKWIQEENPFSAFANYCKENNENGVIILDAINEVRILKKSDLISDLNKLISGTKIKLIISYRNGDIDNDTEVILNKYPSLSLFGFNDEIEAAIKFAEHYDININEVLEINFNRNPLMLKIFCEQFRLAKKKKGLRGTTAATFFFESYYKEVIKKIYKEKNIKCKDGSVFPQIQMWNIIAKDMAKLMIDKSRVYLLENEMIKIIDNCNLNINTIDLINHFIIHNIIEKFMINYKTKQSGYKFSFQKISDFLIVRYMLNAKPNNIDWKTYFSSPDIISFLNEHRTLIEALVEDAPPRCNFKELFEVIDTKLYPRFTDIYIRGLKYRSNHSFGTNITKKRELIFQFLKTQQEDFNVSIWWEMIFSVMIVPYHPFNYANYTNTYLINLTTHNRDLFLFNISDYDYNFREKMLSLLKVPYYSNLSLHNTDFLINLCSTYFWLLSLSDRELRDKATKALTMVLNYDFTLTKPLMEIAIKIDDQYIIERLLASIYSALVLNKSEEHILYFAAFCRFLNEKTNYSNYRIKYYFKLINKLIPPKHLDTHRINLKKSKLSLSTHNPNVIKSKVKFGLKFSGVYASLLRGYGDFLNYVADPKLSHFNYYEEDFIHNNDTQYKNFFNSLDEPKQKQITEYLQVENTTNEMNLDELLETLKDTKKYYNTTPSRNDLLNKLSPTERELFDFFSRQFNSIKYKKLSHDTIISSIVDKMFTLGYDKEIENSDQQRSYLFSNYSRHDHKIERLGKKYQWIALFQLVGECYDNLKLDDNYYDEDRLFSIDIDPTQFLPNNKKVYDFNFLFNKATQLIDTNWSEEDFVTNFNNTDIIKNYIEVSFEGNIFIPLFISSSIENTLKDKDIYFRLYSHIKNNKEAEILTKSLDEYTCHNDVSYHYEYNLEEFIEGSYERKYEEEMEECDFLNTVKSCHIESEYDYSNIDITHDNKNRTYYSIIKSLIEKMNLSYDYAGIFYDSNHKVAIIQSPFDDSNSYVYIRKDLILSVITELYFAVYSQKQAKTTSREYEPRQIGSEYDAIYTFNNKGLNLIKIKKRPYIPLR